MSSEFGSIDTQFTTPDQARNFLALTRPVGRHADRKVEELRRKAMCIIFEDQLADKRHRAIQVVAHCFLRDQNNQGAEKEISWRMAVIDAFGATSPEAYTEAEKLKTELMKKVNPTSV